jgi:hypothetical protein
VQQCCTPTRGSTAVPFASSSKYKVMVRVTCYSEDGNAEVVLALRRFLVPLVLVAVVFSGWLAWREVSSRRQVREAPVVTIDKQPVAFASHTFDPAAPPPAEMPTLAAGESAECDSSFLSNTSVGGETRRTDATHAILAITHVKMMLQLNINIWVPTGAAQVLVEHEEGHRQISEYSYQTADKLAERIATAYIGKQVEISGTDLDAESSKMLQQLANEINDEYSKELDPLPPQRLYDGITDHGKNGVAAQGAVNHAIKNIAVESSQPAGNPRN